MCCTVGSSYSPPPTGVRTVTPSKPSVHKNLLIVWPCPPLDCRYETHHFRQDVLGTCLHSRSSKGGVPATPGLDWFVDNAPRPQRRSEAACLRASRPVHSSTLPLLLTFARFFRHPHIVRHPILSRGVRQVGVASSVLQERLYHVLPCREIEVAEVPLLHECFCL